MFNGKFIEKYYGDKQGIISKIVNISKDVGTLSLRGEISIFTKIDTDGNWFDVKSLFFSFDFFIFSFCITIKLPNGKQLDFY